MYYQEQPFGSSSSTTLRKSAHFSLNPLVINIEDDQLMLKTRSQFYAVFNMKEAGFKFGVNWFKIMVNIFYKDENGEVLGDKPDQSFTLQCEINFVQDPYSDLMVINNIP
jgi:hypothetical protein